MLGRCVYRCDNDVVDHQLLSMEMDDEVTMSLSMEMFTNDDFRKTHIRLTGGEIDGDERTLWVRRFRGGDAETYDFLGHRRTALPRRGRPAADRRFHPRAPRPFAAVPHHDRRFDREPPHLLRRRTQPPDGETIRMDAAE